MDTEYPADSIEFCPAASASDIFLCGTYQLEQSIPPSSNTASDTPPEKQRRRGKCLVYQVDSIPDRPTGFHKIQEIALPAVLDMKWCHRSKESTPVVGIADSEGNISLHQWVHEQRSLISMGVTSCAPPDVLCLSLDWSNRRSPANDLGSLVVSLSDGRLCILRPADQSTLVISDTWPAHEYEPWIAAWNYWDTNIIYSGGDDLKLKGWDTRQGFEQPIFVNKRFDAGVTTIQNHPYIEHLIAVGSYDDTVRLFDTRKPTVPLATTNVGGGAWRVKWHPLEERQNDLLVACMHDGFKVVEFNLENFGHSDAEVSGQVASRFTKHESMGYGVDWSFDQAISADSTVVASCSFYDHVVHMWNA